MLTDYHCHVLPSLDDGAKDISTSRKMLMRLRWQGIDRVIATPHYDCRKESVETFLKRREAAFERLAEIEDTVPAVKLGAEVAIEKHIASVDALEKLTMAKNNVILLELPYESFSTWMADEIYNICYNLQVRPMLAHVERYLKWYSQSEMQAVLSIKNAIFQVNYGSLLRPKALKFSLALIQEGYPVVLGTDAHNMDSRPPNVDINYEVLQKKLTEPQWRELMRYNRQLMQVGREGILCGRMNLQTR